MADMANEVRQKLVALGVSVEGYGRVAQMVESLQNGYVAPHDEHFPMALEAWRDIQILAFVLDYLPGQVQQFMLQDKLRLCMKDTVLPQDSLDRSPGRDTQAELHFAAVCARGGMQPCLQEPDIVCQVSGKSYGIAVKRLKNADKIEQRFRNAADQIERAQLPGFVALDLTVAFNRDNVPLVTNASARELRAAHRRTCNDFRHQYHDKMKGWIRGREVRGVILVEHRLHFQGGQDWFLETFNGEGSFSSDNQRRQREFDAFVKYYKQGLPNLQG
jgi:hypothetical protein